MKTFLFLCLLIHLPTLQARIGEDLGTCMQRYGDPVHTGAPGEPVTFQKAGLQITAQFNSDGRVDLILFEKAEIGQPLTEVEIQHLLSVNLPGPIRREESPGYLHFSGADPRYLASYATASHYLVIATRAGMDRYLQTEEATERKALSGF